MNLRKLLLAGAAFGSIVTAALAGPAPGINSPWGVVWDIPIDSIKWSYALGFSLSPSASSQDIYNLCGDPLSSVVTRLTRINIQGRGTGVAAGSQIPIFIYKRAGVTTGGLYSVETPFFSALTAGTPYDTQDNSGVPSKSQSYAWTTGNLITPPVQTLGTNASPAGSGSGLIAAGQVSLSPNSLGMTFDWGTRPTQAPVLRGSNQCIAVNLSTSGSVGALLDFQVEWTEE